MLLKFSQVKKIEVMLFIYTVGGEKVNAHELHMQTKALICC